MSLIRKCDENYDKLYDIIYIMIKSQVNDTVHYSTFKLRVNL